MGANKAQKQKRCCRECTPYTRVAANEVKQAKTERKGADSSKDVDKHRQKNTTRPGKSSLPEDWNKDEDETEKSTEPDWGTSVT